MCVWHDMHRELTVNGHLREVQIVEASKDMDVPYNFYVAFLPPARTGHIVAFDADGGELER
jgi:hypothetical protein